MRNLPGEFGKQSSSTCLRDPSARINICLADQMNKLVKHKDLWFTSWTLRPLSTAQAFCFSLIFTNSAGEETLTVSYTGWFKKKKKCQFWVMSGSFGMMLTSRERPLPGRRRRQGSLAQGQACNFYWEYSTALREAILVFFLRMASPRWFPLPLQVFETNRSRSVDWSTNFPGFNIASENSRLWRIWAMSMSVTLTCGPSLVDDAFQN